MSVMIRTTANGSMSMLPAAAETDIQQTTSGKPTHILQCHLDNDLKTKTKGLTIRKKGSQFFLFLKNMFFRMTIKQMLPSA